MNPLNYFNTIIYRAVDQCVEHCQWIIDGSRSIQFEDTDAADNQEGNNGQYSEEDRGNTEEFFNVLSEAESVIEDAAVKEKTEQTHRGKYFLEVTLEIA